MDYEGWWWGSQVPGDIRERDLTVIDVAGWPAERAEAVLLRARALYRDRRQGGPAEQLL